MTSQVPKQSALPLDFVSRQVRKSLSDVLLKLPLPPESKKNAEKISKRLESLERIVNEASKLAQLSEPGELLEFLRSLAEHLLYWGKYEPDYLPPGLPTDRFVSPRKAAFLIDNKDVVCSSGFGALARCSTMFYAIRDRFIDQATPKNLTWITVSGQGSRGKAFGSLEEIGLKGLVREYISGHVETARDFLLLAEAGDLELHTLPQGEMTFLIEAQSRKEYSRLSETGIGTFLDRRVGGGSLLAGDSNKNYAEVKGDKIQYSLPPITKGIISASYADKEGNIYFKESACLTESREIARAAKANGGKVIAIVSDVREFEEEPYIKAELIDAIVVDPHNEQTAVSYQKDAWDFFYPPSKRPEKKDYDKALHRVNLINRVMQIAPNRSDTDKMIARLAAYLLKEHTPKNGLVNIGVGMGEEVVQVMYESGDWKDYQFLVESGAWGGVPTSGLFFGGSIYPEKIISSYEMFHQYASKLDATVLGFLQVDGYGNVNVSHKNKTPLGAVGPGGFCDITENASTIIFMGRSMLGGRAVLQQNELKIEEFGRPKFVNHLEAITFNASRALVAKKRVYYVCESGVFCLKSDGIEMTMITPGVDFEELDRFWPIPLKASPELGPVPREVMTGMS